MERQALKKQAERFVPLVRLLGKTLGKDAEVMLYGWAGGQPGIVFACNGEDESVPEPLETDMMRQLAQQGEVVNVLVRDESGRPYRVSAIMLGESGAGPACALAIRFDLSRMQSAIGYLSTFLPRGLACREMAAPPDGVEETVNRIIDHVLCDDYQVDERKRSDKLALVQKLDEKGVFLARNSVEKVSERLRIAPVTVYSYLDVLRKKRRTGQPEE